MMIRLMTLFFASALFAAPALAQTTFDCPEECEDKVWGDANGDGTVNLADLLVVLGMFNGQFVPCDSADANGDGVVNIADAIYIANYLHNGGPAPIQQWCCDQCDPLEEGDVNMDGVVNLADAIAITSYLNGTLDTRICLAAADVTGDGVIDEDDAKALLDYLFTGGPPPSDIECID